MRGNLEGIVPVLQLLIPCAGALIVSSAPAVAQSPSGTPAYVEFQGNGKANVFVWRKSDNVWNLRILSIKGFDAAILQGTGRLNAEVNSDPKWDENSDISLKVVPTSVRVANPTDIAEIDLTLIPVTASSGCTVGSCRSFYYEVASPSGNAASYCATLEIYNVNPAGAERAIRLEYEAHPDYIIKRLGTYKNFLEVCGPSGT